MDGSESQQHALNMRESRNKMIEAEVETRRVRAEKEKVLNLMINDERECQVKFDDLSRTKRQLQ